LTSLGRRGEAVLPLSETVLAFVRAERPLPGPSRRSFAAKARLCAIAISDGVLVLGYLQQAITECVYRKPKLGCVSASSIDPFRRPLATSLQGVTFDDVGGVVEVVGIRLA
jgi:hypothetical protein